MSLGISRTFLLLVEAVWFEEEEEKRRVFRFVRSKLTFLPRSRLVRPNRTPTQLHALFYTTPIGEPGGGGFWPNSTTLAIPVVLQAPA